MKLLLTTKKFSSKFIDKELEFITGKKYKTNEIDDGVLEIDIDEKNLIDFLDIITSKSRLIEYCFLEILKFKKIEEVNSNDIKYYDFLDKDFTFEVEILKKYNYERFDSKNFFGDLINKKYRNLSVNLKKPNLSFYLFSKKYNYLVLDLIGFNLLKKDYKININSLSINSIIPNYCFYLLDLDKKENYSILDPLSNLGDLIIEASLFNPRYNLNVKKKYNLKYYLIFNKSNILNLKNTKNKNKFYSVVQKNNIFKKQKENISYLKTKIKLSKYDLEWLDIKFDKESVDYCITFLPFFKEDNNKNLELQKTLFYQLEFIIKKKNCIITKGEIKEEILKKYNLKINYKEKIYIGEQHYNIFIVQK